MDDEKLSRQTTVQQLRESGYVSDGVEGAYEGLKRLEDESWDVILADLRMPNMDGIEFLKESKRRFPDVDVIIMTAYGTVGSAVTAMQQGAADFLTKPFSFQELEVRLNKLAKARETQQEFSSLKAALDQSQSFCGLVGHTPSMRVVFERIELFADKHSPVLVQGETGTGKELVSRALHTRSSRSRGAFVPLACGAIPRDLAESEIFGHEKGAFTGASQRRKGSFERAHSGSLLFDDIDDLPLEIQAKLLRTLQEGRILRVGGEEEVAIDARIIATTKVDLARAVHENRFREDLYYRLCGLEIRLPPLREREGDILLLAQHFLRVLAAQEKAQPKLLSVDAAEVLRRHPWPGNVRELRRVLEYAVAVCRGPEIHQEHIPEDLRREPTQVRAFSLHLGSHPAVPYHELIEEFEDEVIQWALRTAGGEQSAAAKLLGLPRTTLQSKLLKRNQS